MPTSINHLIYCESEVSFLKLPAGVLSGYSSFERMNEFFVLNYQSDRRPFTQTPLLSCQGGLIVTRVVIAGAAI